MRTSRALEGLAIRVFLGVELLHASVMPRCSRRSSTLAAAGSPAMPDCVRLSGDPRRPAAWLQRGVAPRLRTRRGEELRTVAARCDFPVLPATNGEGFRPGSVRYVMPEPWLVAGEGLRRRLPPEVTEAAIDDSGGLRPVRTASAGSQESAFRDLLRLLDDTVAASARRRHASLADLKARRATLGRSVGLLASAS